MLFLSACLSDIYRQIVHQILIIFHMQNPLPDLNMEKIAMVAIWIFL